MQPKLGGKGFLSRDITVRDLLLNRSEAHHVYPRDFLERQGLPPGRYDQVANLVIAQSEINIAIGNRPPKVYFAKLQAQCDGGPRRHGGLACRSELEADLQAHALPSELLSPDSPFDLDRS